MNPLAEPGGWRLYRSPLPWLSALLIAYLVVPVALFLVRSAGQPSEGFALPGLFGAFATSAEAATISMAVVGFVGVPLAYLLARRPGKLSALAGIAVQLPLALPPLMSGVVLLYLFGPNSELGHLAGGRFTESVTGIVMAQSFVSSPFLVVTARSAFRAVDPNLEDVAATAGLGPLSRFIRVAVPLAGPGIRAGLLLTWLRAFGEYGATVMMSYYPFSLPVFTYVQFSAVGLPATQAPTLLALGLAVVVVALSRVPLPKRRAHRLPMALGAHTGSHVGASTGPGAGATGASEPRLSGQSVPVGFELSITTADFHLELAYQARSHRLAIVGPSGAGKSLTLRALAGLLPGAVSFAGRAVGDLPAERRRAGYVPQGQSLLPDRSAWANVMLGPHADSEMAAYWLEALGISRLAGRLPAQISGGQRQRVALARALACRPRVLLLDEPFTGLDAPARTSLVKELRRLQLRAGLSSVLVTHDVWEAALLAEEILVISKGKALQDGTVPEVLRRPRSPEAARALGFRNLSTGVASSRTSLRAGGLTIPTGHHGLGRGTPVTWSVRPEHVGVSHAAAPPGGAFPAQVLDVVDLGAWCLVTVVLDGGLALEAEVSSDVEADAARDGGTLAGGAKCWVSLPPAAVLVWPAAGRSPTASGASLVPGSLG